MEAPEQIVAEPDGDAPLESGREHERGVEGGVLERHRQDDGDGNRADVEGRRMPGQRALEPLQRAHRRGAVAAEEKVQQRHEEADAEPLEEHDEERAREDGREEQRLAHEVRAQEREDSSGVRRVAGARPSQVASSIRVNHCRGEPVAPTPAWHRVPAWIVR